MATPNVPLQREVCCTSGRCLCQWRRQRRASDSPARILDSPAQIRRFESREGITRYPLRELLTQLVEAGDDPAKFLGPEVLREALQLVEHIAELVVHRYS